MPNKDTTHVPFFWSLVERVGSQAIRFVFSVALARLLAPEHFGLIGIVVALVNVGEIVLRSGMGVALIREKNLTQIDKSSLFFFSILVGFVICCILLASAHQIAIFYGLPILAPITTALAAGLLFNAISVVPTALLMRDLRFSSLGKATLISHLIAGLLGVWCAMAHWGVWSLVVHQLGGSVLSASLALIVCNWRPSFVFSIASLRRFLPLTMTFVGTNLMESLVTSIYYAMLGRMVPLVDVGYYNRGKQFQETPVATVYQVISRPALTIFARQQESPSALLKSFRRTVRLLVAVTFPMMAGLAVCAPALTHVVLGEKWMGLVKYLQVLCLLGILYPLHRIAFTLMAALGRTWVCAQLEFLRNSCLLISLVVLGSFGMIAIIWGQVISAAVAAVVAAFAVRSVLEHPLRSQFKDIAPYILATLATCIVIYLIGILVSFSAHLRLASQFIVGSAVYLGICMTYRLRGITEPVDVVCRWIRKKRSNC